MISAPGHLVGGARQMAERTPPTATTASDMDGNKPQQVATDTPERDAATGGGWRPPTSSSSMSSPGDIPFEAQLKAAISQRRADRQRRKQLAPSEPEQRRPAQRPARLNQTNPKEGLAHGRRGPAFEESPQGGEQPRSERPKRLPLVASLSEPPLPPSPRRNQAHRCHELTRSRTTTAARSQRRGSIFEKTSIKLNRLLESSISMLPPPDLSRAAAAARQRTRLRTTRRNRRRSTSQRASGSRRLPDSGPPLSKQPSAMEVISEQAGEESALDRDVDGGYAWIILGVMFVINASTFGTARAYGMIYDKLAREGQLNHDQAARPFNVMGAIENMAGPLTGCLLARSTSSWRVTVFTGSCLVTLAHLLAALTPNDSPEGHLLSMGLMCGLGLSFVTISFFQINNAYFVRYRSRAFGIGISGAAFGTLYIAKLCQWALDEYEGTSACYLVLCLLLAPNVPLSLLLKTKSGALGEVKYEEEDQEGEDEEEEEEEEDKEDLGTISMEVQRRQSQQPQRSKSISIERLTFLGGTKQVLRVPIFHLIWPTQLLFCWFNFVLGMIMVDFAKDRGLSKDQASYIVPVWAFGQLTGRLFLSSLVDLKLLSYRSFTVTCFAAISLATYILNELKTTEQGWLLSLLFAQETSTEQLIIMLSLIFVLSAFIALLYILLNGLVVSHLEQQLQPLSMGISSFLGSFFLLPRASVIGFFRDTTGNYDSMLSLFSVMALVAALTWLIVPTACECLEKLVAKLAHQMERLFLRRRANVSEKPPQTLAVITLGTFRPGFDAKAEKTNFSCAQGQ